MKLVTRDAEELHALLHSRGWDIFCALVFEMYGDDSLINDLYSRANSQSDLAELGRHTAVLLSTRKAIDNILAIPKIAIEQIEGSKK